jgi:hypothetical protein
VSSAKPDEIVVVEADARAESRRARDASRDPQRRNTRNLRQHIPVAGRVQADAKQQVTYVRSVVVTVSETEIIELDSPARPRHPSDHPSFAETRLSRTIRRFGFMVVGLLGICTLWALWSDSRESVSDPNSRSRSGDRPEALEHRTSRAKAKTTISPGKSQAFAALQERLAPFTLEMTDDDIRRTCRNHHGIWPASRESTCLLPGGLEYVFALGPARELRSIVLRKPGPSPIPLLSNHARDQLRNLRRSDTGGWSVAATETTLRLER